MDPPRSLLMLCVRRPTRRLTDLLPYHMQVQRYSRSCNGKALEIAVLPESKGTSTIIYILNPAHGLNAGGGVWRRIRRSQQLRIIPRLPEVNMCSIISGLLGDHRTGLTRSQSYLRWTRNVSDGVLQLSCRLASVFPNNLDHFPTLGRCGYRDCLVSSREFNSLTLPQYRVSGPPRSTRSTRFTSRLMYLLGSFASWGGECPCQTACYTWSFQERSLSRRAPDLEYVMHLGVQRLCCKFTQVYSSLIAP